MKVLVRPRRLVRLTRSLSVLSLAAGALVIGYGDAPADAAETLGAPASSWYWADQIQPLGAQCAPAPAPPDTCVFPLGQANALPAPDVPAGDLVAGARQGQRNKVSVLSVDLSTVPEGATVEGASLRLVEDTGSGNQNNATGPPIVATPVDYYAENQDARPINEAPDMNGTPQKAGSRAMTGTDGVWTFDVTGVLNACLQNFQITCGVGLRPGTLGSTDTFQVVWVGPRSSGATVTDQKKPSVTANVVSGSGTTTTTTEFVEDVFEPPSATPPSGPTEEFASAPFLSVGPPVAPPAAAPTTTIPSPRVAAPRLRQVSHTNGTPPLGFWLAVLGMAGLLGCSMVALGPAGEPSARRQGSVMRTLERKAALPGTKE